VHDQPDISPERLSAIDVASLDNRECRAALVLLAGDRDPVVAAAVVDAVRRIVTRTRC
jgi:hypothetical protein